MAARDSGLLASFMPKPFTDLPGCGLHVHLGLQDESGSNLMAGDGPAGLSELGSHFVAGLLVHAPALAGLGSTDRQLVQAPPARIVVAGAHLLGCG